MADTTERNEDRGIVKHGPALLAGIIATGLAVFGTKSCLNLKETKFRQQGDSITFEIINPAQAFSETNEDKKQLCEVPIKLLEILKNPDLSEQDLAKLKAKLKAKPMIIRLDGTDCHVNDGNIGDLLKIVKANSGKWQQLVAETQGNKLER